MAADAGQTAGRRRTGSDRHREVVVRAHQPAVGRDDAVPVGVRVVAGRDGVLVLAGDQRRHRGGRRAVHPDLAVPVQGHEPPGGVDQGVHHRQVEAVPVCDLAPVADRRPAERVGADPHAGLPDPGQVDGVRQVVDVCPEEVVRRRRSTRPCEGDPSHPGQVLLDVGVRSVGDPGRGIGVGRAAVRRVVLEPAVRGRVVRRGHDDAVGEPRGLAEVGAQDRVRHRGGGGVPVPVVDQHGHVVGHEHLEG